MSLSGIPQQRTRIKVCGLTEPANARAVEACGVDAIGLVFYEPSPRAVTPEQAAVIAAQLGPLTHRVGLFVNATGAIVRSTVARVGLTVLQFHGDETEAFCTSFGLPYFKALRMKPGLDVAAAMAGFESAAGFLLDAYRPGVPGGTGEQFDWGRVPQAAPRPILLAGGLTAENVAQAIAATGVYGVDVSGGVESAPGVKDIAKVQALVAQVQRADGQRKQI